VNQFWIGCRLLSSDFKIKNIFRSVFCYHQRVKFLERFYDGALSYAPRLSQGFVVLKPSELIGNSEAVPDEFRAENTI
jgi:hypothetical protein